MRDICSWHGDICSRHGDIGSLCRVSSNCCVGITLQMCNRVTNPRDMGIYVELCHYVELCNSNIIFFSLGG